MTTYPKSLDILPIEQDSCLLRGSARPLIRRASPRESRKAVVLRYSVIPRRKFKGKKSEGGMEAESSDEEESGEMLEPFEVKDGEQLRANMKEKPDHCLMKKDRIWVMDFVGCDIELAKEFIKTLLELLPFPTLDPNQAPSNTSPPTHSEGSNPIPEPLFTPDDVLLSPSLNRSGGFITGISLRAEFEPKELLTLFVSIPYLGLGKKNTPNGSLTLHDYRLQDPQILNEISTERILVHQTWFLVFGNGNIGIFRSEDDKNSNRAPLFPYQQRVGAFQALVHMISNTLTSSETEVLEFFRKDVAEQETEIEDFVRKRESAAQAQAQAQAPALAQAQARAQAREQARAQAKMRNRFERSITDVHTMIRLVRFQIQNLKHLQQIFQNSFEETVGPFRPHRNRYRIPFVHEAKEQITSVMKLIEVLVAEREELQRELNALRKDMKFSRNLFLREYQSQDELVALNTAKETKELIRNQGQTISVFTFITSVFLPLGFLAGYYAISPPQFQTTITTQKEFWKVTGPTVAVIGAFMLLFIFLRDDQIRKFFKRVWGGLTGLFRSPRTNAASQSGGGSTGGGN